MRTLSDPRFRRAHATLIAVALIAAVVALLLQSETPIVPQGRAAASVLPATLDRGTQPYAGPMSIVDGNGKVLASASSSSIATTTRFRDLYPAQANAGRDPSQPATNYWAVLIGINEYAGSTRDNIGSYQDARDLRKHLLNLGWRSDHIVLLANRNATASMIIQSIRWLASKTNSSSTVIFNYAGHEIPRRSSADGDNENRDILIHASDNRYIYDGTLGKELNRVRAAKMWLNFAVCRAYGFRDAGTIKTGRVLTYASKESQLAYEDPAVRHTVLGWYQIMEGMVQKNADANRDGNVTVEEAFKYAKPRAIQRSSRRQTPLIVDKLSGNFYLKVPKPQPAPSEQPPPSNQNCIAIICTGTVQRRPS